jgi:electron transfer flavoprotein beta subunit
MFDLEDDKMEIIVCVKQVPNTTDVQMDPKTKTLLREGVAAVVNPFDLVALEAALNIKNEHGANITVLSMGPPQAVLALRECLARGADRAVLLSDRALAGADTLATSHTIAKAIETKEIPFDIIFCGLQAVDGDTGQVGPGLAEFLNIPILANAIKVQTDIQEKTVTVERWTEEGIERLKARIPLMIIADRNLAKPGALSDGQINGIEDNRVEVFTAADLGGDPEIYGLKGSATWVDHIGSPKPIGHMKIDPNLHYQERIRLILSGGLEDRDNRCLIKDEPADKAVERLVEKLLTDDVISRQG